MIDGLRDGDWMFSWIVSYVGRLSHSTRKVSTVRCVRGLSLGACAVGYMRGVLSVVSTICVPGLYPISTYSMTVTDGTDRGHDLAQVLYLIG